MKKNQAFILILIVSSIFSCNGSKKNENLRVLFFEIDKFYGRIIKSDISNRIHIEKERDEWIDLIRTNINGVNKRMFKPLEWFLINGSGAVEKNDLRNVIDKDLNLLRALINAGADVNGQNPPKFYYSLAPTPIHTVLFINRVLRARDKILSKQVKILVDAGAEINLKARDSFIRRELYTPLEKVENYIKNTGDPKIRSEYIRVREILKGASKK